MIDYDLVGGGLFQIESPFFRKSKHLDTLKVLLKDDFFNESGFLPWSGCDIEIDAKIDQLIVKSSASQSALIPGLAELWDDESARRRHFKISLDDMEPEVSQIRSPKEISQDAELSIKLRDVLEKSSQANPRVSQNTSLLLSQFSSTGDMSLGDELANAIDSLADFSFIPPENENDVSQDEDEAEEVMEDTDKETGGEFELTLQDISQYTPIPNVTKSQPLFANSDMETDQVCSTVNHLEPAISDPSSSNALTVDQKIHSSTPSFRPKQSDLTNISYSLSNSTLADASQSQLELHVCEHNNESFRDFLRILTIEIFAPIPEEWFGAIEVKKHLFESIKCSHHELNPLRMVSWNSSQINIENGERISKSGVIVLASDFPENSFSRVLLDKFVLLRVSYVDDEKSIFTSIQNLVASFDPDVLCGFETHKASWGYLYRRAKTLGLADFRLSLDRIFVPDCSSFGASTRMDPDCWPRGRVTLNVWNILRKEFKTLTDYSIQNLIFHCLKKRVPTYSLSFLSQQWFSGFEGRTKVLAHLLTLCEVVQTMLFNGAGTDTIHTTMQLAKVFGMEFYEVLSRGSQYRVECVLLRITKSLGFAALSVSPDQRSRQLAPECTALTLEPESAFFGDPVIVMDFQSLYPSIMIAHNYCYSTCLGRLRDLERLLPDSDSQPHLPRVFGCLPDAQLSLFANGKVLTTDDVSISPNEVVFVKPHVRQGVVSLMVNEILRTRLMVKRSIPHYLHSRSITKLLEARQLGLKLLANVTYGYTAANFSGRMPCIEVADSIVRKARQTLERSIKLVNTCNFGKNLSWQACRVVYGDTDSLFVVCPKRSVAQAFQLGKEMCTAITADNPSPIKLKLEKVYHGCFLQAKKRYAGWAYDAPESQPRYDAKGIETVRRDGCPLVSKLLHRSFRLFFANRSPAILKNYLQAQFAKIERQRVSVSDFVFAREFRKRESYAAPHSVPAIRIADKNKRDALALLSACGVPSINHENVAFWMTEPLPKQRVPYVFQNGPPKATLISCVRDPFELLNNQTNVTINTVYYVQHQLLPALDRLVSLLGHDVSSWFKTGVVHALIPLGLKRNLRDATDNDSDRYLATTRVGSTSNQLSLSEMLPRASCFLCAARMRPTAWKTTTESSIDNDSSSILCFKCKKPNSKSYLLASFKLSNTQTTVHKIRSVCGTCEGGTISDACLSLQCPALNSLIRNREKLGFLTQAMRETGTKKHK